ncbi:hypothetical protein [Aureivirga marina]|uniref:hypothetical protein n=1 Tax=Aureivirga marina TaxID=1182451 RepID=UPI0018CA5260|nr:hypothetical protein [Aureivirga marina]
MLQDTNCYIIYGFWGILLILNCIILLLFQKRKKQLKRFSKQPILDMQFNYTKKSVAKYFNELGIDGRKIYKKMITNLDMIFPVLYSLFFIYCYLAIYCFQNNNTFSIFPLFIPILAMFFDYLENLYFLSFLKFHPILSEKEVKRSLIFTRLKWIFVLLSILFLIYLLIF